MKTMGFGKRLRHCVYSAQELTDLLTECGFAAVTVFGDLAGAEYDNSAKRLVVVATKEKDNGGV